MGDDLIPDAWAWLERWPLWLRISTIVGAAVVFIVIWWLLPLLLYAEISEEGIRVKAITDTRTALLAGLVGIGALGTFWLNSQNVRLTIKTLGLAEQSQKDTVKDATERRVTELYTKAADQLGNDQAPVRLAGLYALERLAQDNPTQRQTIVNVVCAYLQMPYTPPGTSPTQSEHPNNEEELYEKRLHEYNQRAQEQRVRLAALDILSRHISWQADPDLSWNVRINLSGAHLHRADLMWASLEFADLTGADLTGADLSEAVLFGAALHGTNFTEADLREVDLSHASWTPETAWPNPAFAADIRARSDERITNCYEVRPSPDS